MDITAASAVARNQANTRNEFAIGVLKKALDSSSEQGAELAKMVAQTGGVGQRVDLFA